MIEGLFQPTHLIFLLAIALLIFGPRKLPELGQGLGKGIRGFKDALRGISEGPESHELQGRPAASPSTSTLARDAEKPVG
jgi:sec-independent protein translocase protein TatA